MEPRVRALLEATAPEIEAAAAAAARAAVDRALGIAPPTAVAIAGPICEALADVHREDLALAEAELPAQLSDEHGGTLAADEPVVLLAVEDFSRPGSAHGRARRFDAALREALAQPPAERKTRVKDLLAVERLRLERRAVTRVRRAVQNAHATVRLSGGALDASLRRA